MGYSFARSLFAFHDNHFTFAVLGTRGCFVALDLFLDPTVLIADIIKWRSPFLFSKADVETKAVRRSSEACDSLIKRYLGPGTAEQPIVQSSNSRDN